MLSIILFPFYHVPSVHNIDECPWRYVQVRGGAFSCLVCVTVSLFGFLTSFSLFPTALSKSPVKCCPSGRVCFSF